VLPGAIADEPVRQHASLGLRMFLFPTLRNSQFTDRSHEILFGGPPQLSAEKWARCITSASITFRGELTVSVCSRLVAIRSREGVIHRRALHELLALPPTAAGRYSGQDRG
jgi:hypothetical protein